MKHGLIATAVKGAFKIYLVPTMRTRSALTTVTGGWHDLVSEARQEHEAHKQAAELEAPDAESVAVASASTAPTTESRRQPRSKSATPITPRRASGSPATARQRDDAAARHYGEAETSPSLSDVPETEGAASPHPPTLVETGEASVEVRPNPAISPPHVTSGVVAHISPEVRHKLAGDGPIRA